MQVQTGLSKLVIKLNNIMIVSNVTLF